MTCWRAADPHGDPHVLDPNPSPGAVALGAKAVVRHWESIPPGGVRANIATAIVIRGAAPSNAVAQRVEGAVPKDEMRGVLVVRAGGEAVQEMTGPSGAPVEVRVLGPALVVNPSLKWTMMPCQGVNSFRLRPYLCWYVDMALALHQFKFVFTL